MIWHYCMRITTTVSVRTGIYGWSLNNFTPSKKLYDEAMETTRKLKDKAKEETLKDRIASRDKKRKETEKKEKKKREDGYHHENPHGGGQESTSSGITTGAATNRARRLWNGTRNGNPVLPV